MATADYAKTGDIFGKFKQVRQLYTWTTNDQTNGYAEVPIVFEEPFADDNYTAVWSPNDVSHVPDDNGFFNGDYHEKAASGFIAVVYAYSPGFVTPGSIVEINVIAIHD